MHVLLRCWLVLAALLAVPATALDEEPGEDPRVLVARAAVGELEASRLLPALLASARDPLPAVREALAAQPPPGVLLELVPAALALLGRPQPLSDPDWQRCVALVHAVLERTGGSGDVQALFEASEPRPSADLPLPAALEDSFQAALEALCERDEAALAVLGRRLVHAPAGLHRPALSALGSRPVPAALEALLELHGRLPELDVAVLGQASRIARSIPWQAPPRLLAELRDGLERGAPQVRRERVLCLAWLDDRGAVPDLIDLLGSDDSGLRATTTWALRRLTGLGLRDAAEPWRAWYESELAWWEDEAPDVLGRLQDPRPARQLEAVRALGQRRAPHGRLVAELCWALDHACPSAAALAAQHLGRMRAVEVRERLLALVDHPDEDLAAACRAALGRMHAPRH